MKIILPLLMLCFCTKVLSQGLESFEERALVVEPSLSVVDVNSVAVLDRLATLGNLAVVRKDVERDTFDTASLGSSLLVVRDPRSGRYGTSDGSIIIRTVAGISLNDLAFEYGLAVKHSYSELPMGVLSPSDSDSVWSYLSALRMDSRVIFADLDVNFYDFVPR
tara:strand:- start:293 stop:784 length:492 start_codon:yes stop_codon:yes gene_type:complete